MKLLGICIQADAVKRLYYFQTLSTCTAQAVKRWTSDLHVTGLRHVESTFVDISLFM